MKTNENGTTRELTAEEIAEINRIAAIKEAEGNAKTPTPEQLRIVELEEALAILLSGRTE